MNPALDLLTFVTRSENRVRALRTLADGPASRVNLQATTGIARPTLSRILKDFRERDLAMRDGYTFEVTPLGESLASGLADLLENIESAQALQAVAAWLPLADIDIAVGDLDAVSVTLPTPTDPMAPIKRAARAIEGVDRVRAFCYSVVHAPILAECRNVTERGNRFEGVVAAGVLQVVADEPDLRQRLRELVEAGNAELYVREGAIEPQLIIAGRTTMFLVTGADGAIQGLVEIGDEVVLPWAVETFESLRAEARPLTPARVDEVLTP